MADAMATGQTPLARAKARATGVLGQLRRLLSERVAGFDSVQQGTGRPSAGLIDAVTAHATQVQTQVQTRVNGSHAAPSAATSSSSTTRPSRRWRWTCAAAPRT